MSSMDDLKPGLAAETETTVTKDNTAERLGSGSVPVFGTPALVGLMEGVAIKALESKLPPGLTSVGGHIDVRHLAPTPVGMRVRARAELIEVKGRRLVFQVEAWDEKEQIGEATHERFIVDRERFLAKAAAKS
jgi:fluoroacetyl-CoA thioesterase